MEKSSIRGACCVKQIPSHATQNIVYSLNRLVAHLVVIVCLVLAALVLLVVLVVILHIVGGNLGVVDDLATGAATTLNDIALVNGVTVGLALLFIICCRLVKQSGRRMDTSLSLIHI